MIAVLHRARGSLSHRSPRTLRARFAPMTAINPASAIGTLSNSEAPTVLLPRILRAPPISGLFADALRDAARVRGRGPERGRGGGTYRDVDERAEARQIRDLFRRLEGPSSGTKIAPSSPGNRDPRFRTMSEGEGACRTYDRRGSPSCFPRRTKGKTVRKPDGPGKSGESRGSPIAYRQRAPRPPRGRRKNR